MKKFYITVAILAFFINLLAFLILDISFSEFILFALFVNLICGFVFLIFFFLLKKFQKTWLKIFVVMINICLIIFLSFAYLFLGVITELFDLKEEHVDPSECYEKLKERTYYPEAISHFPRYVPDEYKNAYCLIENDFHGYNIHFLKFDADKIIVDDVIEYNKEKIDKKYEFEGVEKYYKYLEGNSSFGIENKKDYFVYIMKNPYKEKHYVSGIIAPKENGTLIFFFANWNIQNTDEPPKINATFEEGLKENSNAYNIYTKDEIKKVCAFAQKIKNIVDKEDFNAYAGLMKYPLKVNFIPGESLIVTNKQEFLKLAKKSIFNKNLKNKLKYKNMSVDNGSFMLGNGDIWFEIDDKGSCKIVALNIME